MTQVDFIRKMFYSQGMKVSEIEKELNYDRKTIEKYLDKEDWNIPIQAIKKEATFAKLEPVKPIINGWLLWYGPSFMGNELTKPYQPPQVMCGSKAFYIDDPDGNAIEIMQYTEDSIVLKQ